MGYDIIAIDLHVGGLNMKLKSIIFFMNTILLIMLLSGCTKTEETASDKGKITIAVSIVPQETFVKAVAGDLVEVITMIPPGNSPTNYQPTPKQMVSFSKSKLYFSMGVPAEDSNILPKVKDLNENIKIISLDDIVGEVYPHRYFEGEYEEDHGEEHVEEHEGEHHEEDHEHIGRDPHIWLSPKRVKIMINTIKDELTIIDPTNKSIYEKNAKAYIDKIEEVDKEIKGILSGSEQQSFIIYHPSFGYFAEDYGLEMITIEQEGKEATINRIREVVEFAKKENIRFVFYQEEFDSNQAKTIAKEIGGATIKVAPLAPNYIENLKRITNKLREVLR